MEFNHIPVLLNEVLSGLNISPDGIYLDCTIGGAGHSIEILKRLSKNGKLYGVDKDIEALNASKARLKDFNNVEFIKSDFKDLQGKIDNIFFDGILIDLGVSSYQIDTAERGFSFLKDGKLDMRMDLSQSLSAYDVVNFYPKEKLEKILFEYGEERNSRLIVKNILKCREAKLISTTLELNQIIEDALPAKFKFSGASKRVFQAIRIEVNGELDRLAETLRYLVSKLKKGGRLAVISFHSLEDRIVKQTFADLEKSCTCPPKTPICICGHKKQVDFVNKKPIIASDQELEINQRSRSAKLRVVEKI